LGSLEQPELPRRAAAVHIPMQRADSEHVSFTVYQPNFAPAQLSFGAGTITLGRASDCTIPIRDRFLSRHHAEIVYSAGQWLVRDCGSVNGTLLNGSRLSAPTPLKAGDRIGLGDSEVVFQSEDAPSQLIAVDSSSQAKNLAIPIHEAIGDRERTNVLASLAVQFIEDRPMSELFDFILDRVMETMQPSRTALALLSPDGKTFPAVRVRRRDAQDSADLVISRTLLAEVIQERNVVAYVDTAMDEKLAQAQSIVLQDIRSAVCAPLMVGEAVLGVLYLDFRAARGAVTHEDVRLIAQIARFAAVKLETTRLREEAVAKALMDEELRTAYGIQSRLLPEAMPSISGYTFAATNKPCKTVSGDYYDVVVRPDGLIYFIVADVSGKGITAALIMSALATAFNIFSRTNPSPSELMGQMNAMLAPKTSPSKFATVVVGVLDPKSGAVEYTNAGHVAPLLISKSGVAELTTTDLVIGLFPGAHYRTQSLQLDPGDSLVLFTDGVTEAENDKEEQLGLAPVAKMLGQLHRADASRLLTSIDEQVRLHLGIVPPNDDVTMLAVARNA
jgi:serine phosphatase RsbU (regulator of sigma subunit)/pSer/pThr/pTyr-binding forkhead associated (FHA) protein